MKEEKQCLSSGKNRLKLIAFTKTHFTLTWTLKTLNKCSLYGFFSGPEEGDFDF